MLKFFKRHADNIIKSIKERMLIMRQIQNLTKQDVENLRLSGIIELKANGHDVDTSVALDIYPILVKVHALAGHVFDFEFNEETNRIDFV
jgi:predicted transcriptional regulator